MSTRSLTVFEKDGEEIVVMYRHSDGYPSGHGIELCQFLSGIKIVNGIISSPERLANGMNCLAAQVVAHFKNDSEVGGIYLHKAGTRDLDEEYVYKISYAGDHPYIKIFDVYEDRKIMMEGYPEDVLKQIDAYMKREEKDE